MCDFEEAVSIHVLILKIDNLITSLFLDVYYRPLVFSHCYELVHVYPDIKVALHIPQANIKLIYSGTGSIPISGHFRSNSRCGQICRPALPDTNVIHLALGLNPALYPDINEIWIQVAFIFKFNGIVCTVLCRMLCSLSFPCVISYLGCDLICIV